MDSSSNMALLEHVVLLSEGFSGYLANLRDPPLNLNS
jgi:hypothetical protein